MVLKLDKRRKKAFLFTLFVIMLLFFLLVSLSIYYTYNIVDSSRDRVKTLNEFVLSMEKDIPRKMYISGFRIIFLMINEIVETGEPITNFNETFEEGFFDGTINGKSQSNLNGATFNEIIDSLNETANKINAEIIVNEQPEVIVKQENPWEIKFSLKLNITIKDKSGTVSWERVNTYDSIIPIVGFEDPLYLLNTKGLVTNRINKTDYKPFTLENDVSNLTKHLEGSYYIESNLGPSFIDRIEGKTSANENGIESMVYLPKLVNSGVRVTEKSCIDYVYFSTNNPETYRVNGMPNWFKIDKEHVDVNDDKFYNVSHLVY